MNGEKPSEKIIATLKAKNGSLVKIEGFIILEQRDNKAFYTTGIFRDVTKNKENEERLRQNENNLLKLLVHAPDAIIVIDEDGIIQFWNPKAESIFGWSFEEVNGKTLSETIIPLHHREGHEQGMKRYLKTGEVHVLNKTIEITALNKSSEEFFVSLTVSTTQQQDKTVFIAFIRDITAQKSVEYELEKKRKELEVSNRELEQFAHVASHDMKEPVRKISMYTERTVHEFGDSLPEPAKNYLQKVLTGTVRLNDMITGILNYSSLSKINEPSKKIDLEEILRNIESDLELLISEKNARIIYGELPKFEGISFLIYQLFYNLIHNALKFSQPGRPPVVQISGRLTAELPHLNFVPPLFASCYAEIYVEDNGIGFSQELSTKIFDAFVRLNSKDQFEGTGLGLALCKNIVERHNGFILAEGNENMGATFKIYFPC